MLEEETCCIFLQTNGLLTAPDGKCQEKKGWEWNSFFLTGQKHIKNIYLYENAASSNMI